MLRPKVDVSRFDGAILRTPKHLKIKAVHIFEISASTQRSNPEHLNSQQDRQCTYNRTLRRVRVTVVAVEKQ